MDSLFRLGVILSLQDAITSKLSGINAWAAKNQKSFANLRTAIMGVGTALAVVGAGWAAMGVQAANAFGGFEQKLAAVAKISGASQGERGQLFGAAIQAGIDTQFSPTEAAGGLELLASQGMNAQNSMKALVPVLDLAAGAMGQIGVESAAEAVGGTLNSYSLGASEAGLVTDKLLSIMNLTNFAARDFSAGLSTAAAFGGAYNQSLDDILITMGLLRNRNIDASVAATGVREALRNLGANQEAKETLHKMGVEAYDATGKMRPMLDIMGEFAAATGRMTDEKRTELSDQIFGVRGGLAIQAVSAAQAVSTGPDGTETTLKGADAIAYLRDKMSDASGAAKGFRDAVLDTYAGQQTLLKGSLETAEILAGQDFAGLFRPLVEGAVWAVNEFIKVWQDLPESFRTLLIAVPMVAGGIAAIGLAIAGLITILPVLSALFLASPIGWVTLAAVALGVAITALVVYWDEISGALSSVWDWLSTVIPGWDLMAVLFGALYDAGSLALLAIIEGVRQIGADLDWLIGWVGAAVTVMVEAFGLAGQAIKDGMGEAIDWLAGAFGRFFAWLDEKTFGLVEYLSHIGTLAGDVAGPVAEKLKGAGEYVAGQSVHALSALDQLGESAREKLGKMFAGPAEIAGAKEDRKRQVIMPGAVRTLGAEATLGERPKSTANLSGGDEGKDGRGGGENYKMKVVWSGNLVVSADDILKEKAVSDALAKFFLRAAEGGA